MNKQLLWERINELFEKQRNISTKLIQMNAAIHKGLELDVDDIAFLNSLSDPDIIEQPIENETYDQHLTRLLKALEDHTTMFLTDEDSMQNNAYDAKYDIKIIVSGQIFNLGFNADLATQLPMAIESVKDTYS